MTLSRFRLLPRDQDLGWSPYGWLIYFPALFVSPALSHSSAAVWIATIATAVAFLPLYFRGFWSRGNERYWVIAVIALLGMLLSPVNPGAPVLTIYAASFAGALRPNRRATQAILLVVAAALLEALVLRLPPEIWTWQAVISIVVGFSNTHFARVREMNHKLRQANEEIAHLAKVAERERIARDLHDLLGHTLSLITLKAALASRLADRDPVRAAVEIRDVERISRETLAEVRAAVAGYRDSGLASELVNADSMLTAAGVSMSTSIEELALSPAEETVLALLLREAVTNIVRHAHATHCEVVLSMVGGVRTFQIEDDGSGKRGVDGNGITGMRERVRSLGGDIAIESLPGTRVRVTLAPIAEKRDDPPSSGPARLAILA